jgi:type VI secretion system FHA domain protein
MTIKVRVQNQLEPGSSWEVILPEPIATIGRQATCAVSLLDPEKHVSRVHATIEARDGAYFLVVSSRVNPVLVDGETCIPGASHRLKNGSRLAMYPFELAVEISANSASALGAPFAPLTPPLTPPLTSPSLPPLPTPSPPAAAMPSVPAQSSGDPFAWLDDLSGKHGGGAVADPFGLGGAQGKASAATTQPDPFRREAPLPSTGLVEGLGSASPLPNMGNLGLGGNLGVGGGLGPDLGPSALDPLALFGGASPSASSTSLLAGGGAGPRPTSLDNFLGVGLGPAAPSAQRDLVDFGGHVHQGSSALDHVHDFNLPFHPQDVATPLNTSAPATPAPPLWAPAMETPVSAQESVPKMATASAAWAAPTAAPMPSAMAPAPAQPPVGDASQMASNLQAFLKGLGATGFSIPQAEGEAFLERAGEIVRASVEGLITLLLARSEVKKELRAADRTMLASHNNNPLKFMGGADEAVRFLFDPQSANAGAFLPPVKAVEDACNELIAHEMALVAGMRAAVVGAIKRFDPALLEQEMAKSGGLVLNKKARLWELQVDKYEKMQQEMADNLDRLFESDFLSAYSEQVWRMQKR